MTEQLTKANADIESLKQAKIKRQKELNRALISNKKLLAENVKLKSKNAILMRKHKYKVNDY